MVQLIIDDAELTGGNTVNLFNGVYNESRCAILASADFHACRMIVGCVADLECYTLWQLSDTLSKEVEAMNLEVFLVGCLRVIAVAYI